jgi:hypothetical protein
LPDGKIVPGFRTAEEILKLLDSLPTEEPAPGDNDMRGQK